MAWFDESEYSSFVHEMKDELNDRYRSYIHGEGEKNTQWRFGAPPNYDVVNKLFEEGRTQEWPMGSLEEKVQRMVKTWEMELFHKVNPEDFKTMDPEKYRFSLNGRPALELSEMVKLGGYNVMLATSLPPKLRAYDPSGETSMSSHQLFTSTFPRGFAFEISQVYSGPPVVAYKFRHWAFMEGPFKGHAPTGDMAQFYGIGIFEMDKDTKKIVKVEMFYDPGELIAQLLKGQSLDESQLASSATSSIGGCPLFTK